jgi:hypothetical protein
MSRLSCPHSAANGLTHEGRTREALFLFPIEQDHLLTQHVELADQIRGTIHVPPVLVCMGSKSEYLANARECEGRAQEMPPALRQTFDSLAAHWRKLASNAAEDRRSLADQEAADRRKADKG